jgi:hypothetical protein
LRSVHGGQLGIWVRAPLPVVNNSVQAPVSSIAGGAA